MERTPFVHSKKWKLTDVDDMKEFLGIVFKLGFDSVSRTVSVLEHTSPILHACLWRLNKRGQISVASDVSSPQVQ